MNQTEILDIEQPNKNWLESIDKSDDFSDLDIVSVAHPPPG